MKKLFTVMAFALLSLQAQAFPGSRMILHSAMDPDLMMVQYLPLHSGSVPHVAAVFLVSGNVKYGLNHFDFNPEMANAQIQNAKRMGLRIDVVKVEAVGRDNLVLIERPMTPEERDNKIMFLRDQMSKMQMEIAKQKASCKK